MKAEQANDLRYKGRRASLSQLIRETGRDPDDVFNEIRDDQKKLEELGISIDMSSSAPAPVENTDGKAAP